MNGSRQMEVHYIDTGFPYTATESFMDFFEGLNHVPVNYGHGGLMHNLESGYWSMNMNSYKYELPDMGSSYYGHYEVNDHSPTMDVSRRTWENTSAINTEEPATITHSRGNIMAVEAIPEECIANQSTNSFQVNWQDNVDPDNMTYEELLDLGEAVGSQSRGLSKELISMLPTSKYKCGCFFSIKKLGERCVICQMRYKRGNLKIRLPCKHEYHSECIRKWLSISKMCPVCNIEVFGEQSRH